MALEDFGGKPSVTILENRTTGRKKRRPQRSSLWFLGIPHTAEPEKLRERANAYPRALSARVKHCGCKVPEATELHVGTGRDLRTATR